jgi:hypothetical protein
MKGIVWNTLTAMMFLVLWGMSGCNDDGETIDTSAPVIELEDPAYGEFFVAGNSVHFEASFTDDIELGSYKIDIHNNFDGHAHGRVAKANDDPALIKWSFSQSFDFAPGLKISNVLLHDELEIPQNTMAGPYHFIVSAVDKSGNATSYQDGSTLEVEIYITNTSMPVVDITNLVNDELEIEVGQVFMITGTITDPTVGTYAGMHSVKVILGEGHHGGHDHDHGGRIAENDLIDFELDENGLADFMEGDVIILEKIFEEVNFSLSQAQLNELIAEEVDYLQLMIKVYDEQGNIAVSVTDVHVHMD